MDSRKTAGCVCTIFILIVSIFLLVFLTGCENRDPGTATENTDTQVQNNTDKTVEMGNETDAAPEDNIQAETQEESDPVTDNGSSQDARPLAMKSGPYLNEVVHRAMQWSPGMTAYYGKPAPDYTFTDIEGNTHTLSDYRGREVMVVFWATWCGPCLAEVPHLIELRKEKSKDELMIIAISNEAPRTVENFVKKNKINYTVAAISKQAPVPFSYVQAIPTAFFIDQDGKFKIITTGLVPPDQMEDIIESPGWKKM